MQITPSLTQASVLVNGTTADVSTCLRRSRFGIGLSSGGRSDMGTGTDQNQRGLNPRVVRSDWKEASRKRPARFVYACNGTQCWYRHGDCTETMICPLLSLRMVISGGIRTANCTETMICPLLSLRMAISLVSDMVICTETMICPLQSMPMVISGGIRHGNLHRDHDLPAAVYANGDRWWYQNDKLHRERGSPAIIKACGCLEWWENGKFLRSQQCRSHHR